MTYKQMPARVGFFSMIGSAIAVAAAVEARRAPETRDLMALGIDPEEFRKIRRR